jgi:hypothetical protein
MLSSVSAFSKERIQGNYIQRLASAKSFFKNYRLIKWVAYCHPAASEISRVVKAIKAPFYIPRALTNGLAFFDSELCIWKRASYGIKAFGAGATSIVWINEEMSELGFRCCLKETAAEFLGKTVAIAKIFSSTCETVYSGSVLFHLFWTTARSGWEERELLSAKVAWGISLVKNIIKLLMYCTLGLCLLAGCTVAASVQLGIRTTSLGLFVVSRFFDKDEKKCLSGNLCGGFA